MFSNSCFYIIFNNEQFAISICMYYMLHMFDAVFVHNDLELGRRYIDIFF